MMRRIAHTLIFAAGLAGCATPQPDLRFLTSCAGAACPVPINATVSGGSCRVTQPLSSDILEVRKPEAVILWLLPQGFEFCTDQRDGVWFVTPTDQFYDGWATNDPNGAFQLGGKECKRIYRWADQKTQTAVYYSYKVQFRQKDGGPVCTLDPWIVNN